jgi:hypothetical protein
VGDCQLDFSGFQRTWVTRVTGFWHNPHYKMTKSELQSALAEATQTDKRTKEPWEYSWILLARSPTKRLKRMANLSCPVSASCEAEEESADGF